MPIDARGFRDGATFRADVCVIGGGPAGLVLAAELAAHDVDVLLLESGGSRSDPDVLDLNVGDVTGDAYAGLDVTRHRGIGGTTAIWNTPVRGGVGAKYVPLDPVDFETRPALAVDGWPLDAADLAPHYRRALARCGFPAETGFPGEGATSGGVAVSSLPAPLESRHYLLCRRDALVPDLLDRVDRGGSGKDSRLVTHATVTRLHGTGRRISAASVASPGGSGWSVEAERFVLAGGAVENARLLLASLDTVPDLGETEAWIGRCFMEHPRDSGITVRPSKDAWTALAWLDEHEGPGLTSVLGRIGLSAGAVLDLGLNGSGTLLPRRRPWSARLARRLGRAAALPGLRTWLPRPGHGWSSHPAPHLAFDGLTLLLNLEQLPHPENRIVLGPNRDALGVPRAELRWRWTEDDEARRSRVREVFAEGVRQAGMGDVRVAPAPVDPNAHHHAGTTRMARSSETGVVDLDSRVHGTENLYATGASVFPTCGFANPVLTILALSLRLADHLRS